jgi:hypothetical protein
MGFKDMPFQDTQNAEDTHLTDIIQVQDDGEWVAGKVIELALIGEAMVNIAITILLDDKTIRRIERGPHDPISYSLF